jgi:hypothetical protein
MYQREENAVLLNPHHFKYLADLEKVYVDAGPDAVQRALAKQLFDDEYCFSAGKFVIQAWLLKDKPDWTERDFEDALNKGALTVYLVDPTVMDKARSLLRRRLNSRKMAEFGENG